MKVVITKPNRKVEEPKAEAKPEPAREGVEKLEQKAEQRKPWYKRLFGL